MIRNSGIRAGTIYVALAAFCWGLSGGIGGIITDQGWDPVVVSFHRGVIGLLFVLCWLACRPQGSGLTCGRLWFWAMIAGVGVAGNFAFYFISIAHGRVAVAATLMYCAPVFVYLASFTLKLEKPTRVKWAAIAMVLPGIALLTGAYARGVGGVTLIAAGAGLLAGLSYALFIFAFKYAAPHGSPQAILVIAFTVLLAILFGVGDRSQVVAIWTMSHWPLLVLLGVLGAGLSFLLYIVGLHRTVPTAAAMVAMVEPVTAVLFGVLILNEGLTGLQVVGMGIILVTVTALSTYSGGPDRGNAPYCDGTHNKL